MKQLLSQSNGQTFQQKSQYNIFNGELANDYILKKGQELK